MKVIILAAGKGSRINKENDLMPKVLRRAKGETLISYVIKKLPADVKQEDIYIVVGFMKEAVKEHLGDGYQYCVQTEQLGTGHAVSMCARELENYDGPVMVLYGDAPMFSQETYNGMAAAHEASGSAATIVVCDAPKDNLPPFGRIILDEAGQFTGIVEEKDCTPEQLGITILNVGAYVFDSRKLFSAIHDIRNDNAQGEYYLPDVAQILLSRGEKVDIYAIEDINESLGINTYEDLQLFEQLLNEA